MRLEHQATDLTGNFTTPAGVATPKAVSLIVPGGTTSHTDPTVASLQAALELQGVASLAISLSLGLDSRDGPIDCVAEQNHRLGDAIDEIKAWVAWLAGQGVTDVTVIGHDIGATQVALYAATAPDATVKRVTLLAPVAWDFAATASDYQRRFKTPLEQILRQAQGAFDGEQEDALIEGVGFLDCQRARVTANTFLDYYTDNPLREIQVLLQQIKAKTLLVLPGRDATSVKIKSQVDQVPMPAHIAVEVLANADRNFSGVAMEQLVSLLLSQIAARG